MVAYTNYLQDNRVRRYAEALAKRGDAVDVIALGDSGAGKPTKLSHGITLYEVQRRDFNESGKWSYASRHLRFLAKSSLLLTRLHSQRHYDLIHIHNMPDFLVFSAWYPKIKGSALILDIHDMVPELFADKFRSIFTSLYLRTLRAIEKLSVRFVDHVIISNHLWQDKLVSRSVSWNKCSVFVNHVDSGIFTSHPRTRGDARYIVIFPGSLQWHQGLDIGIESFAKFKNHVPQAEFHLYGIGHSTVESHLHELAARLHIEDSVIFHPPEPLNRIAEIIANADLGIVPKRADSFGNEAYSTKIMEFMSQGVPVVASRTKIDTFYFKEGEVHFFTSGDSTAMAAAMLDVAQNQDLRKSLIARGYEYVQRNGWDQNRQRYLTLVDSLSSRHRHGHPARIPRVLNNHPSTPNERTVMSTTLPLMHTAGDEGLASIRNKVNQAIDDLMASLPDVNNITSEERRGIIARYSAVLEGNFIYWMTATLVATQADDAKPILLDNLLEECRDSHPHMLRKFYLAAHACPTDRDTYAVDDGLTKVRLFLGRLSAVQSLATMSFFEGFIQKFMPYLAKLAALEGSREMEYTDVHGVCDIAHTDGLFRALDAEMEINPLAPGQDVFEGVYLLRSLMEQVILTLSRAAA